MQQQQIAGFKSMRTEQFKHQTPVKTCVQCRWLTFRVDEEEGRDTRNTQQFCQVHVFLTEHVRFHSQTCTTQQVTMNFCQVHALAQYNNVLLSGPCISRWACRILAGNLHNTTQCNSVRSMYFSLGRSSSARRAAQCLRQCIRSMCFCFTNTLYAKTQHNVVLLGPCTHQACETTLDHNTHTHTRTLKHNTHIQMNTQTQHTYTNEHSRTTQIYGWTLKHNTNIQMNTQTQHTHVYLYIKHRQMKSQIYKDSQLNTHWRWSGWWCWVCGRHWRHTRWCSATSHHPLANPRTSAGAPVPDGHQQQHPTHRKPPPKSWTVDRQNSHRN